MNRLKVTLIAILSLVVLAGACAPKSRHRPGAREEAEQRKLKAAQEQEAREAKAKAEAEAARLEQARQEERNRQAQTETTGTVPQEQVQQGPVQNPPQTQAPGQSGGDSSVSPASDNATELAKKMKEAFFNVYKTAAGKIKAKGQFILEGEQLLNFNKEFDSISGMVVKFNDKDNKEVSDLSGSVTCEGPDNNVCSEYTLEISADGTNTTVKGRSIPTTIKTESIVLSQESAPLLEELKNIKRVSVLETRVEGSIQSARIYFIVDDQKYLSFKAHDLNKIAQPLGVESSKATDLLKKTSTEGAQIFTATSEKLEIGFKVDGKDVKMELNSKDKLFKFGTPVPSSK